jgi:ABC-2 type transport system ATP-binding protein
MIQVKGLTKYYRDVAAIEDVSFDVKKGEILGFLGPNGAGKTTTMRIMTGFLSPSSGTASIAGHDVLEQSLEVRRNIGYLPEMVPLYLDMDVRSYLDYCARLRGVPNTKRKKAVNSAIEKTQCGEVADLVIRKCSKGFRQRVGIAQALVHNPPVLVLDEPTIGLDPRQIKETRRLIRGLSGDHTVVLSTHILPEVSQTCERVVIINEGRIVAEDTPDGLIARLRQSEKTQIAVRDLPADGESQLSGLDSVIRVERVATAGVADGNAVIVESDLGTDIRADLAAFVVTKGWGLLEMQRLSLTLEDIFLELTTEEEEGVTQ